MLLFVILVFQFPDIVIGRGLRHLLIQVFQPQIELILQLPILLSLLIHLIPNKLIGDSQFPAQLPGIHPDMLPLPNPLLPLPLLLQPPNLLLQLPHIQQRLLFFLLYHPQRLRLRLSPHYPFLPLFPHYPHYPLFPPPPPLYQLPHTHTPIPNEPTLPRIGHSLEFYVHEG